MPSSPERGEGRARERRTSRVLALGVALPTVLLALGWAYATVRERALREERERAEIEAMLGSLGLAIDEGLEELRAREDERPYYLWGHYYSPPDVLSLTDPVAVSPLAAGPSDPRVVGHFQLASDGRITTPYAEGLLDARASRSAREERLVALLVPEVRTALGGELRRDPSTLDAPAAGDADDATLEGGESPSYWASLALPSLSVASRSASATPEAPLAPEAPVATPTASPVRDEPHAQVVSPLELNTYGSQLAQEINLAQAGDPVVRNDLWERGRAAPQVSRRTRPARPSAEEPSTSTPIATLTSPDDTRAPVEVEYSPMRFTRLSGVPVLVRTVSDGSDSFLQGVVLDQDYLEETWLPRLVSRFVVSEPAARLVEIDHAGACALRRTLAPIAPTRTVCIDAAAVTGAPTSWLTWTERGLLVGLVLVVVLALLAVERAAREERALSRQKSQFVSAVSHELRTPLTTIRMHAEMLADDLVEPERRPRVHEELVGETVRLTRLVENVLEASRLEEGRRPIRARVTDLRAHVASIVADLERFARGKGFELVGPAEGEPLELSFDPGAIEQVVVNLVDNAIKYTGDGERRVEVSVSEGPDVARLVVSDHGEGVPEREKRKVFERFHRIDRATQAHQPGTGLGLSIVRELVIAHGGTVTLRDRAPRGLEVIVELPRGDVVSASLGSATTKPGTLTARP
ncbi:MAG: HAMP domain-containing sensor histidine kinase [Sandaracinus sp.]